MYFDALTMACVADELRDRILGGRVQSALLPDGLSVSLEIYAHRQRHYLLASAHPQLGRVVLAQEKPRRGVEGETGLLLLLRKYVRGAIIVSIEQPPFERILWLACEHAHWGSTHLVVEIMGRHSNIILVGPGSRVFDAIKHVGPSMSAARPMRPGQPYQPPPPQEKLTPFELTEYRLQQLLSAAEPGTPVWQALVSGLKGISPLLAREVAFRALGQPQATVDQVKRLTPLLETLSNLLAPLHNGAWQPTVVLDGDQPVVYAPYPVSHRGQPVTVGSISRAIERYTAAAAGSDPYAAAKRPVREAIAAARSRLERRREALERSLEAAAQAQQWREWGQWILAYAHSIAPCQTELVAETGAGEPVRIPLDPDARPVENAQAYFARYRKAQRAAAGSPERLQQVRLALRDLAQLESDLELAANRPEIDAVRTALVAAGYLRARSRGAQKAPPCRPLVLSSPDGYPILVGRNSRQNDEVTFRLAASGDWWFHARGIPGAHVIVRSEGRDLPPATVQRAAELAAYFSAARSEATVAVDYTPRRHVRRIPGAAPGLVTYSQEQSIRVEPRSPNAQPSEKASPPGPKLEEGVHP